MPRVSELPELTVSHSNDVLVVDDNSSTPATKKIQLANLLAYGNMYQSHELGSQITVTITGKDINTLVPSGITGGLTNGFTFQNSRELKCLVPGTYLFNWSMSCEAGANNQEVMGGIMINSTAQEQTAAHTEVINSSKPASIAGTSIIALSLNDLIQMYVENHTGANNILIDHLTCSVTRIA